MRIISGTYRGRPLKSPQGNTARPTTDRVKESCMSALEHARNGFDGAYVLDAFAGSGALGLEALSRGADYCVFFEKDRAVLRVLKTNISALGLSSQKFQVISGDVLKGISGRNKFDLLLFDPPYKTPKLEVEKLILSLHKQGHLSEDCLVLYEHAAAKDLTSWTLGDELQCETLFYKKYGDIGVEIVRISQN